MKAQVGRAELLALLEHEEKLGTEAMNRAAERLGFEWVEEDPSEKEPLLREAVGSSGPSTRATDVTVSDEKTTPQAYWRAETIHYFDMDVDAAAPSPWDVEPLELKPFVRDLGVEPPPHTPLVPWSRLWPVVHRAVAVEIERSAVDTEALVKAWAKGHLPSRIPKKRRAAWPERLTVWVDRSVRLIPFWKDQDHVLEALVARCATVDVQWLTGRPVSPAVREEGACHLALSDLGAYGAPADQGAWAEHGYQLRRARARTSALVPVPKGRGLGDADRIWTRFGWEARQSQTAQSPEARRARMETLLQLLAFAVRIEPGLLREVRSFFPEMDAGTEADVWNHPAWFGLSPVAAAWNHAPEVNEETGPCVDLKELIGRWRSGVSSDMEAGLAWVAERMQAWHAGLISPDLWAEEVLALTAAASKQMRSVVSSDQIFWALEHFARMEAGIARGRSHPRVKAYGRRMLDRAAFEVRQEHGPLLQLGRTNPIHALHLRLEGEVPGGGPQRNEKTWFLMDDGDDLRGTVHPVGVGAALATLPVGLKQVHIELEDQVDQVDLLAESLALPGDWSAAAARLDASLPVSSHPRAPATGRDNFGIWAEVRVEDVFFRLRWIPAGTFLIGSPEDEEGRYDDEGPQHEVTLTTGYWMAETPCTQALWQAVMGGNPSRFEGPDHPVEKVSWEDTQRFLTALNRLVPGLGACLPTEAQWEYACRAGTITSTYAGPMKIRGDFDAPILEDTAWYGGNSEGCTHPVKQKCSNPWGLYDMLGNVHEWCMDWNGDYTREPTADPQGPKNGVYRVLRGGAWNGYARNVRAAYRLWLSPGDAYRFLGFRISRGQSAQSGEPAEPDPEVVPRAEPRGVDGAQRAASRRVFLSSDRAQVGLRRCATPSWAEVIGRDRYGLWTQVAVPLRSRRRSVDPVRFKLRWIPPGRFWMGAGDDNPEDEYRDPETRHQVTLTEGFWMAETLCTQTVWTAVMGKNPSQFQSPNRPVEQVSWDDVQEFMESVNNRVSGLKARLPTEVQWEYSCRAGTETSTYAGLLDIRGLNNAPILDGIAWYGGNSGVDFNLDNGRDSGGWKEKQYGHTQAGTHPVGQKRPNGWGLYDMLGNVWEWCQGRHGEYGSEPAVDPKGPKNGDGRVIRGGAWSDLARLVRAACRLWVYPGRAGSDLGFRISRGQ